MVGETPGAHHGAFLGGQGAPHQHRPRTAQRDFTSMQYSGETRWAAVQFTRGGVGVAHGTTLAPACAGAERFGDGTGMSPLGKWSLEATVLMWYPGHDQRRRTLQRHRPAD